MLYLFDQDDNFLSLLVEETGLVETWFKDYQNHIIDEPFVFKISSDSPKLKYIEAENQVAFHDNDGKLRLMRMKQLYEETSQEESVIRVICEPSYLELYDHFIEDKRFTDKTAQNALDVALQGSRYVGEVAVELGLASDNFYWIDGVEALFKILETWGGALKDTITLDADNKIIERKISIVQRLGADNGLIVEPDFNAESIERKTLSYVETALWGQGSSLEIEDEDGEATGGHSRYITFEDVVWSKSKGDPVDKPKGQKWVGDPQALAKDGYLQNGNRNHRFGHFSNQDYETPEELLMATWLELQERKLKEIIHEATINRGDKKVSLGDTVTILNRKYNKPIEIQSQITGLEYDILDDEEVTIVIGKYIDMNENPLQKDVDDLKEIVHQPRPTAPITDNSFPDIVPGIPVSIESVGGIGVIQLYWDYDSKVYISHYEVYGSQVADFMPDSQHLLYRGRVSAFAHIVDTDEKWYYYLRAVNTRGTVSGFSVCVEASSVRVITDDILFGSITAEKLANNLDLANKLSDGTLDWINNEPLYQIQESENRILYDVGNRIGDVLNDISGINTDISDLRYQDTIINNRIDGISTIVQDTKFELNELTGAVNHHSTEISTFNQRADGIEQSVTSVQGDLNNAWTEMGLIDLKANSLSLSVSAVRTDFDNLEIGGRNIEVNSNDFSNFVGYMGATSKITTDINVPEWGAIDASRIEITGGSDDIKTTPQISANLSSVITYSFWIKNEGVQEVRLNFNGLTVINSNRPLRIQPNEEGRFIVTGKLRSNYDWFQHQFRTNDVNVIMWRRKVEYGNKATDWSPAPEDKADINQLISYINLSTEGIRIHGQRVHITGQTIIDDAVIGTAAIANLSVTNAKIGTLAVGTAQLQNAAITNAKIANATIDDAKIANLSVTKLLAGEIDTSKIKIRGGSAIDYMLIDGNDLITHGQFTRTWGGKTDTAKLRLGLFGGRVRITNDTTGYNLYMTEKGLSTTMAGASPISAGTLEFHSQRYNQVSRGVTLHSTYGTAALVSDFSTIVLDSYLTSNINSSTSSIYLRPMRDVRSGTNEFAFRVKDNSWENSDGWISFGDVSTATYHSGLRFSKNSRKYTIYATDGDGNIGTGNFDADRFVGSLQTRAQNTYIMNTFDGELRVTNTEGYDGGNIYYTDVRARHFRGNSFRVADGGANLYLGTSSGEVRVTDNNLSSGGYRPIRASSFPTGTSMRENKTDIEAFEESALDTLRNVTPYLYRIKGDEDNPYKQLGLMVDETPRYLHGEAGDSMEMYALGTFALKGIKELDTKVIKIEDRLDEKDLQIQYLTQKIKQLEENAA